MTTFIINRFARLGLTYNTGFPRQCREYSGQMEAINTIRAMKKPPAPYIMFTQDYKEKVKGGEISSDFKSAVLENWASLSDVKKMFYCNKYVENLKTYYDTLYTNFKELPDFNILNTADKKLLKRVIKFQQQKFKKPVKPLNDFLMFMKQNLKGFSPASDSLGQVAKNWLALDESKRKVYREIAKKDLMNYQKELNQWERDMFKQGHYLLIRKKSREEFSKTSA